MFKEEAHSAERYRQAQARKILRLFKQDRGRDLRSMNELSDWWAQARLGPIEPDPEDLVEESANAEGSAHVRTWAAQ
jgi:hypothetical protein